MSVRITPVITVNSAGVAMKIRTAAKSALAEITDDVRKDCNYYAPHRLGTLISQSNIEANSGDLEKRLHWGVPYASYVYKGVSKRGRSLKYSKVKNVNAGSRWCERAKEAFGADWQRKFDRKVKEKYNGS